MAPHPYASGPRHGAARFRRAATAWLAAAARWRRLPQEAPLGAPPKSRRHRLLLAVLRISLAVGAVSAVTGGIGLYLWLDELHVFTLSKEEVESITSSRPQDNTVIYARDGRKIGELFRSYHVFVPYEKLPKDMINAVLAIEDRSFWQHPGFDAKGIVRASWAHLRGRGGNQGASTITQQVVRNFLLPSELTLQRKVQEVALAIQLEKQLSKQQILEIYLNAMFLGNGSYGVGAAAYRYFGKSVDALAPEEAALIAGLFQSPSRLNPSRFPKRAKQRQEQVLRAMQQAHLLTGASVAGLLAKPLIYKDYHPINADTAPYFVDYVKDQAQRILAKHANISGQGLRIYTTLDPRLQKLAEESLSKSSVALGSAAARAASVRGKDGQSLRATLEAALLSVDPATGEILAMVGGRDYDRSKFNRTYQALRSPGSAFKPVVYAQALAQKWKWSDVIFVSPITIDNYRPRTPDEDFGKETTLLRAFYRSMNTPTVELGTKLGLTAVLEQAKRLGIRSELKEEFGSMLGSSDATMMDMMRMYSTFANGGKLVEEIAISKIVGRGGQVIYQAKAAEERSSVAVSPQVAFLMTEAMRAVLQVGTGAGAGHLANVAAGKTGTANDSTDNWFCGYAPNLATTVWVGTDEHTQIFGDVTGGKLALPIWDKYMTAAFKVRPPMPFVSPGNIVTAVINPHFGNRSPAGVRMYFLKGNEPPAESSGAALEALSQSTTLGYRDVFNH